MPLETILNSTHYKVISYKRRRGRSGGGAAIIYDETKFIVEKIVHDVPASVEAAWALLTPRSYDHHLQKIRRICVGSIYISPRSQHKTETIEHLREGLTKKKSIFIHILWISVLPLPPLSRFPFFLEYFFY